MLSAEPETPVWRRPALVSLWLSMVPAAFSWAMSQLVAGWLVFTATNSAVLVGLVYIARQAPLAVTGLSIGSLSDRIGRVPVLLLSNSLGLAGAVLLILAQAAPVVVVLVAVVASALLGVSDAARLVAAPHLAYELAGPRAATRTIAWTSFVAGVGQVGGALIGGTVLAGLGVIPAAAVVGGGYGLSILPLLRLRDGGRRSAPGQHPRNPLRAAIALVRSNPQVGGLFTISLVAEVMAFAGISLDPVFAGNVFAIGASGLGIIVGARAVGRLTGSLVLGLSTGKRPFSRLLPAAVFLFGIGLVGFAVSPVIGVGVLLLFVVGIAGVLVDSLEQAALAAAAQPSERGRAEGPWVLALGLGPIGILEISLLAQVAGPRLAEAANGTVVLAFGLLLVAGLYGKGLAMVDSVAPEVVPDPPLS